MSLLSFDLLRLYYIDDPDAFMNVVNNNSTMSQIYKDLINEVTVSTTQAFHSGSSTLVRLDMDGNIMFSNNDAIFGQTKNDVKTLCSSVQKTGESEIFVADAIGKRAIIIEMSVSDFVGALSSSFANGPSAEDQQFLNAVFGEVNEVFGLSKVIWEYKSDKYITSFYLVPSVKQIKIYDDAIRESDVFVRRSDIVQWTNESSKPISIYNGTTNYDQFQLNPDLSLYGGKFKSGILQPGESYTQKFVNIEEDDYFVYPDILTGRISVTKGRINTSDEFIIAENDGLNQPFSSRIIKVDNYGNVRKSYCESYIVNPRDARPLINGNIVISA
jgi:hypothetical protein